MPLIQSETTTRLLMRLENQDILVAKQNGARGRPSPQATLFPGCPAPGSREQGAGKPMISQPLSQARCPVGAGKPSAGCPSHGTLLPTLGRSRQGTVVHTDTPLHGLCQEEAGTRAAAQPGGVTHPGTHTQRRSEADGLIEAGLKTSLAPHCCTRSLCCGPGGDYITAPGRSCNYPLA